MKKTIKNSIAIIIAIMVVVSLFTFNVSAAKLTVSGKNCEVKQNISISVRFDAENFDLYGVDGTVTFDSNILKLNSVGGVPTFTLETAGKAVFTDTNFNPAKPSKTGSYTLNFTALAPGTSAITVTLNGAGVDSSNANQSDTKTETAQVVVTEPKPSSNANLASIRLSNGSLSPAFNPNTTNYNVTVKYGVESITINGAVADGKSTYKGGGTFDLEVGDQNECILTVTAEDGTKKTYTINIKRMTEQETLDAEQAARDANPLLVVIGNEDYTIVNDIDDAKIPSGFTKETATRKEQEITVLNSTDGKYQLCWLVDANGENGAFYRRDENDNFTKLAYINAGGVMYIIDSIGDETSIPSGFVRASYEIDGIKVDAIQRKNEAYKDFYIFNCYVSGQSENTFYCYDTVEGTMQRAIEYNSAVKQAESEPVEDETQDTNKVIGFNTMNKTGKTVFIMIVVVALMLVLITVLIVVKIVSSRNDAFDDDNEQYMSVANNDFIMSDSNEEEPSNNTEE